MADVPPLPAGYAPPGIPPAPAKRNGWRRVAPIVGVILFLLAGAIGMLWFLGYDLGISALLIGLVAAVLPVPLLFCSFLWLDRYEPEPARYLAFCFAWGAAIATSVALLVNTGASALFEKIGLPDALVAVLVAPFIEESMKALGPTLLFWRRRSEWSGITDGIVYCGLSALGFAMVENVLYLGGHGYAEGVAKAGPETGLQNLFAIFIVRILFTGFAHPLFTSMTGIGLGIAARAGDRRVRWLAPIAGWLLAMMLHGTFNLLPTLSVNLSEPLIMLYGYLGFMVPFFFAVVGFAIALRSWEGRLTERMLPYYVRAGWLSPPEVAALGSLGRRHSARQWARRVAGPAGQQAMKSFQFAATQLALLRDGMQRGLDTRPANQVKTAYEEQRLLGEMTMYRSAFTGRDPQTPQAYWNGENYALTFPDGTTKTVPAPSEPVVPIPVRFAPNPYGFGGPPAPDGFNPYGGGPAYPQPFPGSAPPYGPPVSGYPPVPGGFPGYAPPLPGGAPGYAPPASGGAPGYVQPAPGYVPPPAPTGYGTSLGSPDYDPLQGQAGSPAHTSEEQHPGTQNPT